MTPDPIEEIARRAIRGVENDDSVMNGTVARRAARLAYVAGMQKAAAVARNAFEARCRARRRATA